VRQRHNPWPSFVDLFSSLLIVSFACFIMLCGVFYEQMGGIEQAKKEKEKIRDEANKIIEQVKASFARQSDMRTIVRDCGEDTCIDLYIYFPLNGDAIKEDDKEALHKACETIKGVLDDLKVEQRKNIELIIEGHTDNKPVAHPSDPKSDYVYNWNLSARRAASILYEFNTCGLASPNYRIVSIGYADSQPLCTEQTPQCYDQNRRTTLRLRADTRSIEKLFQ
jgi:outer membrane protein OmpA-like peptidoglycan-associated protein